LIDTSRKRLCYQADPETRKHMEDLKVTLYDVESEISDVMVPNCVYRGGCPEMKNCGFYEKLCEKYELGRNIQERYDIYNIDFYESKR
jgi:hypothetical protein